MVLSDGDVMSKRFTSGPLRERIQEQSKHLSFWVESLCKDIDSLTAQNRLLEEENRKLKERFCLATRSEE